MTRREFLKSPEMNKVRKNINSCAITGYIISVLSLLVNLFLFDNPSGIIDSILIVILCVLIHVLQSRVAAIILTVYGVLNMIIMSIAMGRLSGWWILLIGIYSVVYTFKFQKAWKEEKEFSQN